MVEVVLAVASSTSPYGKGAGWGAVLLAIKDGREVKRVALSGVAATAPEGLLQAIAAGLDRLKRPAPVAIVARDRQYVSYVLAGSAKAHRHIIDKIRKYDGVTLAPPEGSKYLALLLAEELAREARPA